MKLSIFLALAMSAASPAMAATFVNVGDSTNLTFNGTIAGTSSSLVLTLTGEDNTLNTFTFSYVLTNTSSLASNPTSRVRNFGFDDIGADTTTGSATTTDLNGFNILSFDENYPNGLGNREFCVYRGSGNCNGGNSGATVGDTATGSFTLDYAGSGMTQIMLNNFAVRYQSTGVDGEGSGTGVLVSAPVPEPTTWAMLLAGFGVTGYALRRRKPLAGRQIA